MRSRELPIQHVRPAEVDLAERLRVTAGRLAEMPSDFASALSLTTGRQGHSEAEIRRLAATIASPAHLCTAVELADDVVTVTFSRARRASR